MVPDTSSRPAQTRVFGNAIVVIYTTTIGTNVFNYEPFARPSYRDFEPTLSRLPRFDRDYVRGSYIKVGGRPPAPIALQLAAAPVEEAIALWLPPNAHVGPRRRRRRRAPRKLRPIRSRPGMRP